MYDIYFQETILKWGKIIKCVNEFGGDAREIIIDPPASEKEIKDKENLLGFSLPPSFKSVLLNFSKHVELRWFLPDIANVPKEFKDIFSGEIAWNIDWLQDLNPIANDFDQRNGEICELRNKLHFLEVGNGDIIAFDMDKKPEPSVIYWSHEGEGIFYLADSFLEFLNRITELCGVGSEIWQMEYFLDERGLNSSSDKARRWINWFENFAEFSLDENRKDLDGLIRYIGYHGVLNIEEQKAFKHYEKQVVFDKLIESINKTEISQKDIYYKIIGEVLGRYVENWVRSLWQDDVDIEPSQRSYLTSKCLPADEGLTITLSYVESQFLNGMNDRIAWENLCFFRNRKVIEWMKKYIAKTTNGNLWYQIFARSQPTWNDIQEWISTGSQYKMIAMQAMDYMADSWSSSYIKGDLKILNPPTEDEFINYIQKLMDEEILKSKKRFYLKLIDNAHLII